VGDAEFQKKALGKMGDVAKSGRTVLFVSHNMGAVKSLCTCGILLDLGTIKKQGSIENIIVEYLRGANLLEICSERNYVIDENKPFQVTRIEILNKSNDKLSEYEAQEEIKVRIHCVSRRPLPNLYGYFALKTINGDSLIICDSTEDGKDVFNNMPVGEYIVDIIIPAGLLGAGNYIPLLNFTSNYNDAGFNVDSPLEVLRFKVIDSISERGNSRNALTALVLSWVISDKLNEDGN
jgi:lipopolysaccharide transport system ATP-binding protein